MTTLLVMRHAKSDWGSGVSSDLERPLAPRGIAAAERMGGFLTRVGAVPDLVLSSPAVRARTTAELAAEAGGWTSGLEIVDAFYGGDWSDVAEAVRGLADEVGTILVAGHEPSWSDLVSVLIGGGRVAMPTAAVACLDVDGGWAALRPDCAELRWHVTPKIVKKLS